MASDLRTQFIEDCEQEYKHLLCLESFPEFSYKFKTISMEKANDRGYDSLASAYHDMQSCNDYLEIWENLYTLGEAGKHVIFHELTHVLDSAMYSKDDKFKYMANHGYTEYHASQIEMLKLLNAETISQKISFSIRNRIDTVYGQTSIQEYVIAPHALATELIERSDFPADVDTLKSTLGAIFNYYGRRSICLMHATDFRDTISNTSIAKIIPSTVIDSLNKHMVGWFDQPKIEFLDDLYLRITVSLIKKYNLL